MSYYQDVIKFHLEVLKRRPATTPTLSYVTWANRMRLITEEFAETAKAFALEDIYGVADGLVDMTWVVLGSAVEFGLPFDELWDAVRKANMAKNGGKLDPSGKLLKPAGWTPPDIESIILRALDIRRFR